MPSIHIKNHRKEANLFSRRCIALSVLFGLFTLVILARLIDLQLIHHQKYATLSTNNLLRVRPVTPSRGLIYDRHGVLLAKNIPVFNLTITRSKTNDTHQTIQQLQSIIHLTPAMRHRFDRECRQHQRYDPVVLKYQLTEAERTAFLMNRYRFPGVSVEANLLRTYTQGETLSNVVGYVGHINSREFEHVDKRNYEPTDYIGKTGIEKYYESQLHGHVGAELAETNASGETIRQLKHVTAQAGDDLYLTIDSQLQAFAARALGKNNGAVVVIKPDNGEVLALVTHPSYDPNPFVMGISQHDYHQLLTDPNHPLYDRTIRGLYSPGSTIKPFHALNGLSKGVITPNTTIQDPGWFRVPGTSHVFHDDNPHGHGTVDLHKAIRVSCDTYFYNLSTLLGIDRIATFLRRFGFGHPTDIDLPNELSGNVPTPDWKEQVKGHPWYTGDTVNVGIGQGMLLVTPLQLATATAIIAEHGRRYQPHLVLKWHHSDNSDTKTEPQTLPPVHLNESEWNVIIHAMEDVIDHGTARLYGPHPNYRVAGKTGTAQVYGAWRDEDRTDWQRPKKLRNNHLFIDFAPVSHPEIAVAVVVEHASYADTIAGRITRFYLNSLNTGSHHEKIHTP